MAAAVVTVIVEDILKRLGEGMKLGQQWGVDHELIEIRDLLSSVMRVLPEAENKYGYSLELQEWVRDLKHATFDAEDLLEELSTEDALRQRERKVCRLFQPIVRLLFGGRMRDQLRDVARRLQDRITSDRISLITNIPAEIQEAHEEARTVPLIGRDHKKGELMKLLLGRDYEGERDLTVLTVQGVGGIGKTALVKEVCSESDVSCYFDYIVWVNASLPFDENRMAREIIARLTNGGGAPEEEKVVEEQLLVRVGNLLDGRKKYLFILDDLLVRKSEIRRWLCFWSFLEGGATGSKILVTTQHSMMIFSPERFNIYLQGLTPEDSLDLLLKTAFKGGVEEIIDPAKLPIAEDIAAECLGNPLFLRAVGDYLSLQHDASNWSSFRDRVNNSVLTTLLHGGFRDRVNNSVLTTLLHGGYPYGHLGPMVKSYNHLPPRIKRCFGLCSVFPRGHAIDQQTLAELWIALGYINEDYRPLEVIADHYFDQLLMAELFQVKKFDNFGKVRSVVLHPDVEHLACSVAGWECQVQRFGTDLWEQEGAGYAQAQRFSTDLWEQEEAGYARHISIIDCHDYSRFRYSLSRIRTILHFVDDISKWEALYNDNISNLKNLRVFDLHHMNVETVHEGVWKLKLLRYLDLSDNRRIETLPPAITGLLNLQTLKLSRCSALKELPQDMRKMVSLWHLYIDGCRKLSLMPKGLGDLKFLNILTDFILPPDDSSSVNSSNLADLCKLNDLRGSLRITNLSYSEYERKAARETFEIHGLLDEKSTLEDVELRFRNLRTDESLLEKLLPHPNLKGLRIHNYGGTLFPNWMIRLSTNLPNLVEVALIRCRYLDDDCFPQFGQLLLLKSLTIQGLPNLMHIASGSGQTSLNDSDNARPFGNLSSLCIRDCPKLERLPRIPRLAKLTLVNVSEQLFRHPFRFACLKNLRLENIELLDHLPEVWPPDPTCLEELHIGNCPKLNCLSMMMLPRLVKLTLANVSEELFRRPCHLPSLKTLRLENIELLDHLSEHWLLDLTSLKELQIRSCPSLVSLSRGMMHLENLESLSIWNCKVLDLSKDEQGNVMRELQGLESLKFLTIYKASKMENLPEWLSRAYTLRFLCIRSCPNLAALPEWIGKCRSLKLLELVHCPRLTSLPAWPDRFTDFYPWKLRIVGCPHLLAKGKRHSRRL